jgi:hypothetical protein
MAMDYDKYEVEVYGIAPETKSYNEVFILDDTQVARLEQLYDRYFAFEIFDPVGVPTHTLNEVRDELDDYLNAVGVFFY